MFLFVAGVCWKAEWTESIGAENKTADWRTEYGQEQQPDPQTHTRRKRERKEGRYSADKQTMPGFLLLT